MLKLENSIRGLSFSRVAFDLTIQGTKNTEHFVLAIEQKKSQDRVADMQLGNIKKTVGKKMNF